MKMVTLKSIYHLSHLNSTQQRPLLKIFTDRVSTGGNAIDSVHLSVCPSVSTLSFKLADL